MLLPVPRFTFRAGPLPAMLLPVPRFTLLLSTETIPGCFAEAEELPAAYNGICCEDKQMHKNRAEILSILAKIVVVLVLTI